MNTTDSNSDQNINENKETADESRFNRHAAYTFLFLLYSLNALVIGANIHVWGDFFGLFNR